MALSLAFVKCGGDSETSDNNSGTSTSGNTTSGSTSGKTTSGSTSGKTTSGSTSGKTTGSGQGKEAKGTCDGAGETASCKIFTGATVNTKKGQGTQVYAAAFDKAGIRNNCAAFSYALASGGDKDVAAVDKDGLITGGSKSGSVKIDVKSDSKDCGQVSVNNLGDPKKSFRLVAMDSVTRAPIKGVTVTADGKTGTTDDKGVAEMDISGSNTVAAFAAGYNYLAIMDLDIDKNKDLAVYLNKNSDFSKSGGIKGKFKFLYELGDAIGDDEVAANIGIGGSAIGGSLFNLSLGSILGDLVPTNLLNNDVSLPSGLTLETDIVAGVSIEEFRISNSSTLPTFWAFGGSMSSTEVSQIFQQITGGGDIEIGTILVQILPILGRFNHGVLTQSKAYPEFPKKGKDGKACTNKVGTDCLSDFSKFSKKNMDLGHKMAKKTQVTIPALPKVGAKQLNAAIVLTAWDVPRIGFVPAGISAALDDKGNIAKPIELNYTPSHSGLNNTRFGVMAVTTDLSNFGGEETGSALSGLVNYSNDATEIGNTVKFKAGDFLGFATGSSIDASAKKVEIKTVKGANVYRVRIDLNDGKAMEIWGSKAFSGDLPKAPAGYDFDLSKVDDTFVQVATTDKSFNELIGFNSFHIDELNYFLSAFSTLECTEKSAECKLTK